MVNTDTLQGLSGRLDGCCLGADLLLQWFIGSRLSPGFFMAKHKQIPFLDAVSFVDNPEPRCPCVLLLDTSRSMAGAPIQQLYAGLRAFSEELAADPMAAKRVEIALVTFGPVTVRQDFVPIDQLSPGPMVADNDTPLGAAILKGLDLIQSRKQQYQANGIAYYRPLGVPHHRRRTHRRLAESSQRRTGWRREPRAGVFRRWGRLRRFQRGASAFRA